MNAMTIFSKSIEYMKTKLMEDAKQTVSGLQDDDIGWVLTVPAIWSEPAKQFMREAANMVILIIIHRHPNCRQYILSKYHNTIGFIVRGLFVL